MSAAETGEPGDRGSDLRLPARSHDRPHFDAGESGVDDEPERDESLASEVALIKPTKTSSPVFTPKFCHFLLPENLVRAA